MNPNAVFSQLTHSKSRYGQHTVSLSHSSALPHQLHLIPAAIGAILSHNVCIVPSTHTIIHRCRCDKEYYDNVQDIVRDKIIIHFEMFDCSLHMDIFPQLFDQSSPTSPLTTCLMIASPMASCSSGFSVCLHLNRTPD